ncbi:flagellar protein FlaG [Oceanimonas smirnovii]|uniref:Flagellar protein FlaG n=1 Tax=Oceanimonas smirnovii TaxID=264574 RepID=A0ABW7P2B5_9GAMM
MDIPAPLNRQQSFTDAGAQPGKAPVAPPQAEATQTRQAVQAGAEAGEANLSAEQLKDMAGQMQEFIGSFNRSLQFRVDEDSGRNVVTVLDDQGEVIRQIPSEELLDVITRLAEASGGLIDTRA